MVQASSEASATQVNLQLNGKLNENDLSWNVVNQNPKLQVFEALRPLSQLIKLDGQSIYNEFKALDKFPQKPQIRDFQHMDIYSDIHPFKETSIMLGPSTDEADLRYINANRIQSTYGEAANENLIIATQGPIDPSLRNFWKMVHQERVGLIVTLVHQIGGRNGDCHEYFPTTMGESISYGDMQVKLVAEDLEMAYVMKRNLLVKSGGSEEREVTHVHFQGWEDWQLPTGNSRDSLAELVEQAADYVTINSAKTGNDRERLLVHCRAGIGRTGTSISLINSVIGIEEQLKAGVQDPQLSIFSIVRRLREQRIWMVQTDDQYAYIYEFLKTTKGKWINRQ